MEQCVIRKASLPCELDAPRGDLRRRDEGSVDPRVNFLATMCVALNVKESRPRLDLEVVTKVGNLPFFSVAGAKDIEVKTGADKSGKRGGGRAAMTALSVDALPSGGR